MNKKILYFLILGLLSFFLAGPAFVTASPASSTYNFTQTGHWAGDMAGSPSNPDDGNLATASAANYDNIKSDDSNYWETAKASNNNQYDSQVYRFYINEDEGSVTQITPLWNGHSDEVRTDYDLSLLIWNYSNSAWETVQSDSDGSTSDVNLTGDISTNIGNYIDTDKEIALWARFENYESGACPTIYSVDREGKEVLEEETILGLINKRMEKYHYEDLEYAQAQDGKLKIIVKEERPEIAFLNDIKLIVIDSQAKQVLIAPDGSPQTINNLQPVISCKSKRGEDCLKQVLKQDSKLDQTLPVDTGGGINFRENWRQTAWTTSHPQLLDFSKKENLRDWIEVELPPAPADAKTAKLVISASETGILSFAEVDWITTSKENVELFFDLSDNTIFGDHWAKNLYKVVPPKIQIQKDKGEWVNYPDSSFDENIFSTYDTLVFPLDLSLIENNKVRIESMAYTYIYDFVGVDYSDVDYTKYIISPTAATYKGKNILEEINNLDDKRLLLLPYEQTELLFQLPQENQSLNRSYHIQIAGYYQPERRMKGKGTSSFKSILTQIEKDGLFKFVKRTDSELYNLIMTCSTFDYPNRRFLTKFLRALEKKGIDPDKTFPFSPTSVDSLYTDYVEVKITYNSPPIVGTIAISPSSMTPQEQWTNITVPVTDNDTLADVNEVHVEVFYDSAGTDPSAPGTANVQTCAILTWTRGGSPVWSLAPASTTWAINAAGCSNGTDSLTTDNWVFSFKVGKVATHSPSTDDWDIYAKATDSISQTGDNYLRDVEMNWYGEITVETSTVSWGIVSPGCSNETSPVVNITYICNGNYDEQVKTSQNWTSASGNLTLNTTGSPGAGEFSLKADDDATVEGAVQVLSASYTTFDTGTQTTESGNAENNNHLWLSLGLGIPLDTYSGTLYFCIAP